VRRDTLGHYIQRNLKHNPEKVWLTDDEYEFDWATSIKCISKIAEILKNSDTNTFIVKGNGNAFHILFVIALWLSGKIYVPYNRTAQRFHTDDLSTPIFVEINEENLVIKSATSERLIGFSDILRETSNEESFGFDNYEQNKPACYFYTSGTTGNPKIIVSSMSNILRGGRFVSEALNLESSDIIGGTLSLDFDYGVNQIICAVVNNLKYVCCPFISIKNSWISLVSKHRVSIVPTMPFLIEKYFSLNSKFTDYDLTSVRLITSSGAPFTSFHANKVRNLFPMAMISPMYGLSEGFRMTILNSSLYEKYPDSVGEPIGDTEIEIRDPENKVLPSGELGEIWQSSGCVTWGYLSNGLENGKKFVLDKDYPNKIWLRSGDLGYFNSRGLLFVTGRVESQIKRFGIRISLDEIETAYKKLQSVAQVIAVPLTTNETESGIGLVVKTENGFNLSDLQKESIKDIPTELRADKIVIVENLDGNYNGGKPDRTKMKDSYFETK
jgi:acyl-coenzyme A synthetase/AMP-(fatty) acid ligase